MKITVLDHDHKSSFLDEITKRSGQNIAECYQCTKCSGGCPFNSLMDYSINQILEMIVYGLEDELLSSKAIQMCIGCGTCEANCPAGFAMYKVIETLRAKAKEKGIESRETKVSMFNKFFLETVEKSGRSHETGIAMKYVMANKSALFKTGLIGMGPKMLAAGIMGPGDMFPHKIQGRDHVADIFKKVAALREKGGGK